MPQPSLWPSSISKLGELILVTTLKRSKRSLTLANTCPSALLGKSFTNSLSCWHCWDLTCHGKSGWRRGETELSQKQQHLVEARCEGISMKPAHSRNTIILFFSLLYWGLCCWCRLSSWVSLHDVDLRVSWDETCVMKHVSWYIHVSCCRSPQSMQEMIYLLSLYWFQFLTTSDTGFILMWLVINIRQNDQGCTGKPQKRWILFRWNGW